MRIFFSLFLFLAVATNLFSQSKCQRQIEALERQRFEAMTRKDAGFLEKALANDLTYGHSNGLLETKAEHLANIQAGNIVYRSMEAQEMQVRLYRKTAVVNGVVKVAGSLKGKDFELKLRYTDVYVKKRGKWKLAAWQSVRLD